MANIDASTTEAIWILGACKDHLRDSVALWTEVEARDTEAHGGIVRLSALVAIDATLAVVQGGTRRGARPAIAYLTGLRGEVSAGNVPNALAYLDGLADWTLPRWTSPDWRAIDKALDAGERIYIRA